MSKIRAIAMMALAAAVLTPSVWAALTLPRQGSGREIMLLSSVMNLVRTDFVEETPPSKLVAGAIGGMLRSLDPYSQFLDAEAYEDLKSSNEGHFGGVGMEFSLKDGDLSVVSPLDGTPAARAGILPGDHILKIDGKPTREMTLSDAAHALRGPAGSPVTLSILRDGEKRLFDAALERAEIRVPGVKEAKLLEPSIGYARVSIFQKDTARDLRAALENLRGLGAEALILDLRNNPGGPLDSAVETAELFVPAGKTIVTTRGRNPAKSSSRASQAKSVFSFSKILVLVNKGSASDAEIFAAALKDNGLATLVGSKTYGKGNVQSVIPLGNGTAIRLTTSRYYTPNGAMIHEKGIEPDVKTEEAGGAQDPALQQAVALCRAPAA